MNARLDEPKLAQILSAPPLPSAASGGATSRSVLARLGAGPAAVSRVTRRTRRTARFLVGCASHIRRELLPASPESEAGSSSMARQAYGAFMAENICALNGFDVRVTGPVPRQPALLVCNHIGWQDAILINAVVPALGVVKSEVAAWPLVSEIASGLDFLFVVRGDAHSGARVLLSARRKLMQGCSVLTFPEGTTTHGDRILPVHRGMFGLSKLTGFPVIPIALSYELGREASWVGDDSFLPHFVKTVARPRTVSYLDFGAPMYAAPEESAEDFGARARDEMLSLKQARERALQSLRS